MRGHAGRQTGTGQLAPFCFYEKMTTFAESVALCVIDFSCCRVLAAERYPHPFFAKVRRVLFRAQHDTHTTD